MGWKRRVTTDGEHRTWGDPLSLKFALAVTALVIGTLIPALYVAIQRHHETQLELERQSLHAQGELIKTAFEHQMLRDDRTLIERMVNDYGSDDHVEGVRILNTSGELIYSSEGEQLGAVFDTATSPTCEICHSKPPAERADTITVDLGEGAIIRTVLPFRNREECHRCHDPEDAINGILMIDSPITETHARLKDDIRDMIIGVVLMALVLLGGSRLVIRRLILRPLEKLEDRTRAIADGDFSKRVEVRGPSQLAKLGHEFNAMADSISGLLVELRRQRSQLEDVMNSVDDGMLVIDDAYLVVGVNQSFARRIGTTRAELLHKPCYQIRDEVCNCAGPNQRAECLAFRCFETGALATDSRKRVDRETGKIREEEVFASPIFDDDGKVSQVVEVWRDITERKSREVKMAAIQHLASLGMLASGFSHEINTPLNTMLFSVESVRRALRANEGPDEQLHEAREQAELIRTEILRCRQITQQFLSLSRGEGLSPELLDLVSSIRKLLPIVRSAAKDSGVLVQLNSDGALPTVRANDGAVQQVLLNLVINAIHASKRGDVVEIEYGTADEVVWVRIVDRGTGMTPEVKARIFEPFFTNSSNGTGLGLFVSLGFVRKWGGHIRVTSELGHGAAFEVTFPLSRES